MERTSNPGQLARYGNSSGFAILKNRHPNRSSEVRFKIPKNKGVGYDSRIMSESPVHFIAHFTINDADKYRVYEKGFFPILKAHNGTFVTYDDNVTVLEGAPEAGRTVVIQFESEAACMAWWNSPEYRELAAHRHAGTTTHSISIVHAIQK
jgi:uncharacterized protein (DUF1330 family)